MLAAAPAADRGYINRLNHRIPLNHPMYSCNVYNTFNSFDGDNNAGFENEAIEAQIRFETMQDQKRKNSTKKHKKQQWERRQRRSRLHQWKQTEEEFSAPSSYTLGSAIDQAIGAALPCRGRA